MLRKIKLVVLAFFLFLCLVAVVKDKVFDTPQNSFKKIKLEPSKDTETGVFKRNRTLVYKMYFWSIIPMGELRFITTAKEPDIIFSFQASTNGAFVEKFVTAQAQVASYFSTKDLLPYKYTEWTAVKGKIKKKEVLYDREGLLSLQGEKKIKITKETYDPVGAFIHMLTLSLKAGKDCAIPFLSGHDMYILKARLLKEDRGIDEVEIDMRRENLTSSHGGHLHVWLTADNNRVPLLFKSWTPAGYASVVLDRADDVQ